MIGVGPVQVPVEEVMVWPSLAVPEIVGATVLTGVTAAITAVVELEALVEHQSSGDHREDGRGAQVSGGDRTRVTHLRDGGSPKTGKKWPRKFDNTWKRNNNAGFRSEGFPSGQRGQTVNLLAYAFEGSNPSPSTTRNRG